MADVEVYVTDYCPYCVRAKALLKEAGAEGLKISIQAAPAYAPDIPTAQVLQAQLKKVGIDLQIQQMEWAAVLQAQRDGNFDLNLTFNTNRPDPDTYLSVAHNCKKGIGCLLPLGVQSLCYKAQPRFIAT